MTTSSEHDLILESIVSTELGGLIELTELEAISLLLLVGEVDDESSNFCEALEAIEALEIPRFIIDGRRAVLTIALLVCDAGNLIMLMAVGENPIDDCKSPISLALLLLAVIVASFGVTTSSSSPWRLTLSSGIAVGAVSSASKQFNNAFARW
jgi:hypothetical protein